MRSCIVPTTALEVAREQIALGLLVEARDTFERITRIPSSAAEPPPFRAARESAAALDHELATRAPSLRSEESGGGAALAEVTVDGAAIPAPALIAPIKVNPGHHVVIAKAGAASARQELDVVEGETAAVGLALALAPPVSASRDGDAAVPGAESSGGGPSAVAWLRWGGFGVAVVEVAVGAVAGGRSLASASSASKQCVGDRCPPPARGDIDSARTTATISNMAFLAAGVGAALGVTSFFVASRSGGHRRRRPGARRLERADRARERAGRRDVLRASRAATTARSRYRMTAKRLRRGWRPLLA